MTHKIGNNISVSFYGNEIVLTVEGAKIVLTDEKPVATFDMSGRDLVAIKDAWLSYTAARRGATK
jgi:hypothetical protein